jgi:hypothetical protein
MKTILQATDAPGAGWRRKKIDVVVGFFYIAHSGSDHAFPSPQRSNPVAAIFFKNNDLLYILKICTKSISWNTHSGLGQPDQSRTAPAAHHEYKHWHALCL